MDHVLVGSALRGGQDFDRAWLWTVGRGADCQGQDAPMLRRQDFCILSRQVAQPTFDRILSVQKRLLPDAYSLRQQAGLIAARRHGRPAPLYWSILSALTPKRARGDMWSSTVSYSAFICGETCEPGMSSQGMRVEHLDLPLHFEMSTGGLDSNFGLHPARSPVYGPGADPARFLRLAFGLDITGFHPRPGFIGDVEHGNAGRLTSAETYAQREAAEAEQHAQRWAAVAAEDHQRCEERRRRGLDRIASWQAFRAAHPGQGWRPNYEEEHPPPPCIHPGQAD